MIPLTNKSKRYSMFNIERWQEVFDTISKNKLRTFLTSVSVIFGIFILVVLLGVGEGMKNGIEKQFQRDAENQISVYTGKTTVGYKGLNPGRSIQMKNEDFDFAMRANGESFESASSMYRIWSGMVTYGEESGAYRVEGVMADYQFLESASIVAGRFINHNDQKSFEKYVVIGQKVADDIFKDKDPIGEYVKISKINFKVIGVFTDPGGSVKNHVSIFRCRHLKKFLVLAMIFAQWHLRCLNERILMRLCLNHKT